ncbi:MAG: hypothetical protein JXR76_32590 [Deltaproteobacteria bacterium]|nr:hypothetical protein [Deltaproteobacteria bacterium]
MTAQSIAYEQKLPQITAIPKEDIKPPQMPMNTYIHEAYTNYKWAQKDIAFLKKAGFSMELLEDIPIRCDAASEAQSLWQNVMTGRREAQAIWHEESPDAYALRDECLHTMRYAYHGIIELITRVNAIAEGSSDADMIQDLNDISILGKENPEPLEKVGFDLEKLELAAQMSKKMHELKSAATVDQYDKDVKRIRDQAYTHLKDAVDALRRCGQFVFWKDEDRRKGYISQYNRRHASAANKSDAVEQEEAI